MPSSGVWALPEGSWEREEGLEQGNDMLKSRSQENRLEGVKQEAEGLEQWRGGQGGSVTRWGGQRRIQ